MKEYRLLKDLPFAKAGGIFELEYLTWEGEGDKLVYKDNRCHDIKFRYIENFDEWFEEIKTFEIPDKFEMGFYTIFYSVEDGFYATYISSDEFENSYEDNLKHHMAIGWAFETEEETEKHIEWMKARAVLIEDAKSNKEENFEIEVFYRSIKQSFDWTYGDSNFTSELRFATPEDVEASIRNHKEEWKTYLGVK